MRITRIQAENVRNINEVDILPGPGINFFTGPNASGKTALLEAIHVLSRGKSFRSSRINDLVKTGESSLTVRAEVEKPPSTVVRTGVERKSGKTTVRYNGDVVKQLSAQASNLPLLLLLPDTQRLITGDPRTRRHWLDWAMFHVKPGYLKTWKDYHRALRHRNALLKSSADAGELQGWEQAMASHGAKIDDYRAGYISEINRNLVDLLTQQGWEIPEIAYESGWDGEAGLESSLRASRSLDREMGFTRNGIHRGEIVFIHHNRPVARHYSRGQIKKTISCLILAQLRVYQGRTGETPVFLIDDFAAELDLETRQKLLGQLLQCGAQVFITCTELDGGAARSDGLYRFHVEHGTFNKELE